MPERVTIRWVGSPSAESTRFPGEGQSAQGQSGPKARPRGAADGQAVNIPPPVVKAEPPVTPMRDGSGGETPPSREGDGIRSGSPSTSRPRKAPRGRHAGPYRKPTQVCEERIQRCSGEPS